MPKLEATLCNTKSIFTNPGAVKFKIPSFQRRFVWDRNNVKDMFDDFSEDSNNYTFNSTTDLDGYLLGSIVLIDPDNNSEYKVVDGQQRLTTMTLIYKSMANRYNKLRKQYPDNNDFIRSFVSMDEFYYSNIKDHSLKIEQNDKLSYSKIYRDIINGTINYDNNIEYIDENIYEVWEEINDQINSFDIDKLMKFEDYLKDNVVLVKIVCPSEDQAFQLFKVLNDRGQTLEPLDLIKNMFLQKIDSHNEIEEFDTKWKNFSENMYIKKTKNGKVKNHSSDFLRYFIMSEYGKNIPLKKLVQFFKDQIKCGGINPSNIISFVTKLSNYSDLYNNMIKNPSYNKFSDSSLMYCLSLMDIKQFHQLLMMFYFSNENNKDLQEAREEVLLSCIKIGLSTLYNRDLPGEIEKIMPTIVNSFHEKINSGDGLLKSTQSMIHLIDKTNRKKINSIKSLLPSWSLGKKKALNLLKIIDILINSDNGIKVRQSPGKSISLEHILPQNEPYDITKLGFTEDDNYDEIINTIGNLTLLHKNDNSSLKDNGFSIKKEAYGNTDIYITKAIAGKFNSIPKTGSSAELINKLTNNYETSYYDKNIWDKGCIEKRGKELTNLLTDFIIGRI